MQNLSWKMSLFLVITSLSAQEFDSLLVFANEFFAGILFVFQDMLIL